MTHDRIGNLHAFDDVPTTVLVGSRDLLTPPSPRPQDRQRHPRRSAGRGTRRRPLPPVRAAASWSPTSLRPGRPRPAPERAQQRSGRRHRPCGGLTIDDALDDLDCVDGHRHMGVVQTPPGPQVERVLVGRRAPRTGRRRAGRRCPWRSRPPPTARTGRGCPARRPVVGGPEDRDGLAVDERGRRRDRPPARRSGTPAATPRRRGADCHRLASCPSVTLGHGVRSRRRDSHSSVIQRVTQLADRRSRRLRLRSGVSAAAVVILAAGSGSRVGAEVNKVLLTSTGPPVLAHWC